MSGLSDRVSLGDRLRFENGSNHAVGEVAAITPACATVLLEDTAEWLKIGHAAIYQGAFQLAPDDSWIGRIIDANGRPTDGQHLIRGPKNSLIDRPAPAPVARRPLGPALATSFAIFNTVLPIVRGQRVGVFAGSGVGKTSLLAAWAREMQADLVVIALVGERGRELGEFISRVLGKKGLARSIIVAETSDASALKRRRAAFTAMAVAEHFRDQGKHVLLLMDSLTRLAEAHREIATTAGEAVAMRGHPPSLVPLLSSLAERAGPGTAGQGDITAIFTVLVAGSDMDEPVADTARGLLDGHFVLSRDISERGRFPAIDVLQSVSRALPDAASDDQNGLIAQFRNYLALYADAEVMVNSGLYQSGIKPETDRAIELFPALDAFCAERERTGIEAAFEKLHQRLSGPDLAADSKARLPTTST